MEYNDTKHCALNGKTPNQVLRLFWVQNVRMENICVTKKAFWALKKLF